MSRSQGWISVHRKIQESEIWNKPGIWLKIWIYILLNVGHTDKQYSRGTYYFKYEWIAKDCKATYNQVEKCVQYLKRAGQITTKKATHGIIISVLNYAKYQDKINLESDTESGTEAEQKRNKSDNISNNGNNGNKYYKQKNFGERVLHDGTVAVMFRGEWVDHRDKSVKIDVNYYPELK